MNMPVNARMKDCLPHAYSQANILNMNQDAKMIGDAIDAAMKRFDGGKGISQADLARRSGVPQPTINRSLKGRSVPETKTLSKLGTVLGAGYLGKTVAALVDNHYVNGTATEKIAGELSPSAYIQAATNRAESNAEEAPALGLARRVPVVGTAQLGDNGFWAELEDPSGYGDGHIEFSARTATAYALRCRGDSMKPRIKDGEFVIVEPEHTPVPGDEVLVKAIDGRVMVKELLYIRDDVVHLLSVNEAHGKLSLPLAEIDVMHFVSAIAKRTMWQPD